MISAPRCGRKAVAGTNRIKRWQNLDDAFLQEVMQEYADAASRMNSSGTVDREARRS
jgi:hypothetical protein